MQPGVPSSVNYEYVLVHIQQWLVGLNAANWPHGTVVVVEDLLIFGMVLSMFLIVLVVYVLIRLHQVEHEGFHRLEAHEHASHEAGTAETHGNDRWESIVTLANGTSQGDWRRAILEADIMLFDVLHDAGYPGDTVGEQLKNANPIQMTTLDMAWKAHKVRNDVAHQGEGLELTERDVRATIDQYKRVFEEFGAV